MKSSLNVFILFDLSESIDVPAVCWIFQSEFTLLSSRQQTMTFSSIVTR